MKEESINLKQIIYIREAHIDIGDFVSFGRRIFKFELVQGILKA
jgi:hypothetical protein